MRSGQYLGVGVGGQSGEALKGSRRWRARRVLARAARGEWRCLAEALEGRVLLAAVAWDGGGDGTNWHDAKNWAGDVLPGAGDDVTISVDASPTVRFTATAGTVTINSLVSDEALTLSGGTLDVASTLKVNNIFTISGGTLARAQVLEGAATTPFTGGRLGSGAVGFDGIDDYVSFGDPADNHLDLGVNATIETWVRFDALPANGVATFVSKDSGSGTKAKWIFGYSNNYSTLGKATVFHINSPGVGSIWMASEAWTPVIGQWHHLAVVKSGGTYTFYCDGAVNGMAGSTIDVPEVNAAMLLGQAEGAYRLTGGLDDVRIWNTARSSIQITTNRNKQLAGNESGLAGYWQMNEGVGTSVGDATSYATSGTFSGLGTTLVKVTGNASFNGVTVDARMEITGGTLTATGGGATALRGDLSFSGSGFAATGAGTTMTVAKLTSLSGTTITAGGGTSISFVAVATLTGVNLTASDGGQLLFPAVTSYTGANTFDTTIQASGVGSRIDLSHLVTLAGGGWNGANPGYGTSIKALAGGEVVLAGAIGKNPSGGKLNEVTADGLGSVLGVAGVTSITSTNLTAPAGIVLNFSAATTLTNVNLIANDGGQLLFPAATSYTGAKTFNTTIQASGVGSRIDLSHLVTLAGGGWNGANPGYATFIKALAGGEVALAGAIGRNSSGGLGCVITVDPDARLDLNHTGLVVIQGDLASVEAKIGSGYNGGKWDGWGITYSAATAIRTLGLMQKSEGVVVRCTYYGDVNLDGEVNLSDYFIIDLGYLTKGTTFAKGDVNFDGEINLSDYFLIDSAYLRQGTAVETVVASTSAGTLASAEGVKRGKTQKAGGSERVFSKKVIRAKKGVGKGARRG